jgi:hypothetical protein
VKSSPQFCLEKNRIRFPCMGEFLPRHFRIPSGGSGETPALMPTEGCPLRKVFAFPGKTLPLDKEKTATTLFF